MVLVRRRLPSGREVSQVDPGEAALLYREIFQLECYARPGFPARQPQVIVDVGANIGLASLYFHERFPDARIVAAEPGPEAYQALRENCREHIGTAAETRNVAVSRQRGSATLGYYPRSPAESGLYADQEAETELARRLLVQAGVARQEADALARHRHTVSYVTCETRTLSDLLRDCGVRHVDLLKIDVEKGELDVLSGIDSADWPRIRNLVMEVHDTGGRREYVTRLLAHHGFDQVWEQESRLAGTDMHMVFATRPE